MTSLFAQQFRFAAPYDVSATPGGIEVGATLPKPKEGNSVGRGANAAAKAVAGGASSLAASAAAEAAASQGATVGASQAASERQGSLSKLMHLNQVADSRPASDVSVPSSSPVTVEGRVNPAAVPQHGIAWDIGHGLSSAWNYFANGTQLPGDPALTGPKVGPRTTVDSGVTEPSAVYNPQYASSNYTSPTSVSSAANRAIEMGPYSSQFKASFGREAARAGQAASEVANQPSSRSILDELGRFVEDPVEF